MGLAITDGPDVEPVSTSDMKSHLRVDFSDDDSYIAALVKAARMYAETIQCRQLITATFLWTLDSFNKLLFVPRPPLQSVTSIEYVDSDGASQTLATSVYQVDAAGIVGRIGLKIDQAWPATYAQMNAVTVTYDAGYGDAAVDIPETTVLAIKMLVSHWYEQRSAVANVQMMPVPMAVETLLGFESVPEFH